LIFETVENAYRSGSNIVALKAIKNLTYVKSNVEEEKLKNIIIDTNKENIVQLEDNPKRAAFSTTSKLLINFAYNHVADHIFLSSELEYDHLIPQAFANRNHIDIVSAMGNLQLLTGEVNREKSDKVDLKYIQQDLLYKNCNNVDLKSDLINSFKDLTDSPNTSYFNQYLNARMNLILYILFEMKK
jgi:hypothetical protein